MYDSGMRFRPLSLVLLSFLVIAPVTHAQTGFESILVPFDTMTLDAGGTSWRAELWVRNNGTSVVNIWASECFQFGAPVACSRRLDVAPGKTMLADGFEPDGQMPGVLLYVDRARRDDVTFNLRVRDVNRPDSFGTEIPVVREAEMFTGTATLINVPLQPNGRIHLRLYAYQPSAAFTVRVYAEPRGALLAQAVYATAVPPEGIVPAELPLMVDASPIFRGWIIDRVRVTVEMTSPEGGRFWPLLTITNTRNSQITTVTVQ